MTWITSTTGLTYWPNEDQKACVAIYTALSFSTTPSQTSGLDRTSLLCLGSEGRGFYAFLAQTHIYCTVLKANKIFRMLASPSYSSVNFSLHRASSINDSCHLLDTACSDPEQFSTSLWTPDSRQYMGPSRPISVLCFDLFFFNINLTKTLFIYSSINAFSGPRGCIFGVHADRDIGIWMSLWRTNWRTTHQSRGSPSSFSHPSRPFFCVVSSIVQRAWPVFGCVGNTENVEQLEEVLQNYYLGTRQFVSIFVLGYIFGRLFHAEMPCIVLQYFE